LRGKTISIDKDALERVEIAIKMWSKAEKREDSPREKRKETVVESPGDLCRKEGDIEREP